MSLIVLAAYLIGSVPFTFLLARRRGVDLREFGSRNVGASNLLRASGVAVGIAGMLLDMAKGAGSVLLAQRLDSSVAPPAAALAAIIGHVYPVWLGFRGGKGVATASGAFLVLSPLAFPPAIAIFLAGVWITRYVSVGSVLATMALPPIAYVVGSPPPVVLVAIAASGLIVFRHRSNLMRVRLGTERRFGVRIPAAAIPHTPGPDSPGARGRGTPHR